jgi:hypothetical protein
MPATQRGAGMGAVRRLVAELTHKSGNECTMFRVFKDVIEFQGFGLVSC